MLTLIVEYRSEAPSAYKIDAILSKFKSNCKNNIEERKVEESPDFLGNRLNSWYEKSEQVFITQ